MRYTAVMIFGAALALGACGDDDGDSGGEGGNTMTGTGGTSSGTPSGTPTGGTTSGTPTGGATECDVPSTGSELAAFLAAGSYSAFTAESAPHDSAGPHFGDVRTFVNDTLFDSLTAGNTTHPTCSAAIKELYGSGTTVLGHAVMVKVADGEGGDTWYWYEFYEGSTFADGVGESLCTGCHSSGMDHWRSPFPLQ